MDISEDLVKEFLKEIAGENSVPLVDYIKNKINVSEFKIADKLKLNVNQIRNILYKLNAYNLVSSVRKKDNKKGWYIYYWSFYEDEVNKLVRNLKQKRIDELKKKLQDETNFKFFICPNKCMRIDFETAMEQNFKCVECGSLLREQDHKKEIDKIKRKLLELEESSKKVPAS